jgi:hypothetical protein
VYDNLGRGGATLLLSGALVAWFAALSALGLAAFRRRA